MDGAAVMHEDILAKICADTRAEVACRKQRMSLEEIKLHARDAEKPRGFGRALMDATAAGRPGLITEIKKSSPSGGLIRADFDPATLARAYLQGKSEHLQAAHAAVKLPIIRKDFILDPWQVYESRAIGADCILLIMAALGDAEARELEELARALDMDVLAEVHNEAELDRALGLCTPLLGINNRNLKTLETRLETTEALSRLVPPDRFLVSESGIKTHADIERLQKVCVQGFLVGESLMREPDVTKAVRTLLGTQ
jgi:indole-3-glycerol phosphate synthase